ncbi:hypothetical protein GCM10027047_35450 [Rhodococcus aerolatus]
MGAQESMAAAGEALVDRVLALGVEGVGPLRSAVEVADRELVTAADAEVAIQSLLTVHRRLVGATGFVTSIGGAAALAVGLPADVTSYHAVAARLSFAIAHLRGYDVTDEAVRTLVLLCLLPESAGRELLSNRGIEPSRSSTVGQLRTLDAEALVDLQRSVGHKLVASFGRKGALNLVKLVPIVGGGVGAGTNVVDLTGSARRTKLAFPPRGRPRYDEGVTVIDG